MDSEQRNLGLAARVAGALTAVGAVTWVFSHLIRVNPTTVGFGYLITILAIAAAWGLVESMIASIAATLCFNYFFFPPVGTFTIADPQNWVALLAFLVTSLIASHISERARRRTAEAVGRQLEMERLYSLSRSILLTDRSKPVTRQIAEEIARLYELPAVALFDRSTGEAHYVGREDWRDVSSELRESALQGTSFHDPHRHIVVTPIRLGSQLKGGLALQGASVTDTGLQALANLVAVGIETARAQETAARAEAARHSEELKSTLLDALAHEFKTPLTSIKTASSAILSSGVTEPEPQRELLTVIDEEANRLTRLVTEALHLARIEAGKVYLNKEPRSLHALLEPLLRQMESALQGRRVELALADDLPEAFVDVELAQLAIRNLIDNAAKYSTPASPIWIAAAVAGEAVVLRVRNQGPSLSEVERERIFEKFYRGAEASKQATGTGMGLAIAREIALAHGGDLRVENHPEGGVEFVASFPAAGKVLRTWPTVTY